MSGRWWSVVRQFPPTLYPSYPVLLWQNKLHPLVTSSAMVMYCWYTCSHSVDSRNTTHSTSNSCQHISKQIALNIYLYCIKLFIYIALLH
jgi:hypothetical protein